MPGITADRSWHEHKVISDLLWEAYMKTLPDTKARVDAINSYLGESKDFWGEEALGTTQLQGRIGNLLLIK